MRLSVAIPTYNRTAEACNQIEALLQQADNCCDEIEILVLDNASELVVEREFKRLSSRASKSLYFIRNPFNIGMCANIVRCFEHARGDWLWVLGDDDPVLPDAVQKILSRIKAQDSAVAHLLFGGSQMKPPVEADLTLSGIEEAAQFLNSAWRYSAFLFISHSVFRADAFQRKMALMNHWIYSMAPFLAGLFASLLDKNKSVVVPEPLVTTSGRGGWNKWRNVMGAATLPEIEGCEVPLYKIMSRVYHDWTGKKWLTGFPAVLLRSSDRAPEYWALYFFRQAAFLKGPKRYYALFCGIFLARIAKWPYVRRCCQSVLGRRIDQCGVERT